ncbi:hypothetical protein SteCoe_3064 [Stentor coeruleus]|uniref:Uncharacterized protein n=1 Tax=Stentor coeruleus TaxID=5963 RepID=A0A1R2CY24_9CILI|nr:hypothetical protein SteCoe_3064 [Stentor coeruleus]
MLSPVNITWPDKWVFNIVELSSNHAEEKVSVTVNCKIPQGVPKGAVVLLKILGFPKDSYYYTVPETQLPEDDNVFIFTDVILPSVPGAYGPVTIIARNFTLSAQIHAASYNLQSIAVLPALSIPADPLTVTYPSGTTKIVSETTKLKFAFSIQANMNPNDYFVLTCDTNFQLSSTITIEWTDGATGTQYFQDMMFISYKKENIIVIYGLQVSFTDDILASFTVDGLINPSYKIDSKDCNWTIEIFRFGTKTTLQRFDGNGPNSVSSGTISSISWFPSNAYLSSENIVSGLVLYMTLKFTISHKIPYDGYIQIEFSNADINQIYSISSEYDDQVSSDNFKFIYAEPNNKLSCEIKDGNKANCIVVNPNGLSAGTINVYNLVKFEGLNSGIKSLATYTKDNNLIDDASDLPLITYSTNRLIEDQSIDFFLGEIKVSYQYTGNIDKYILYVSINLKNDTNIGDEVMIKFPFKFASIAEEFTINFFGSCEARVHQNDLSKIDKYSESDTIKLSVDCDTLNTAIISLSDSYKSGNYINLFLKSKNKEEIAMPIFESSYISKHEIAVIYTGEVETYVYSKPLFIYAKTIDPELILMCQDSSLLSIPAEIIYTPEFDYKFTSDYSAYINFTINLPDLYTPSIPSGSIYPTSSSTNQVTLEYSKDNSGTLTLIYEILSSFDIIIGDFYNFYLPLPAFNIDGNYEISAFFVFKRNSDSFLFYMSKSSFNNVNFDYINTEVSTNLGSNYSSFYNEIMDFTYDSFSDINLPIIFSVHFGKGYKFGKTSLSGKNDTFKLYAFQSENIEFDLVSCLIFINENSDALLLSLTNIITSWIPSEYDIIVSYKNGEYLSSTEKCTTLVYKQNIITRSLTLNQTLPYLPTSAKLQGADSIKIDISIFFTLPEILYKTSNTYFKIKIGASFSATECNWLVKAGDFEDFGTATNEFYTSPILNTLYKDTALEIHLFNVLVPDDLTLNNDYPGFDEVYAMYDSNIIYSWIQANNLEDSIAKTTFTQYTEPASSSITSVAVFPRTRGSMSVYFYMTFNPQFDLPAGTEILIYGVEFDPDDYLSENLWSKYGFTESNITNGNLYFVTAYDAPIGVPFLIRKDLAFSISENEASPSDPFLINATYKGVYILSDKISEATIAQKLKYTDPSDMSLILPSVSVSVLNKGESSWHAFAFKLPIDTNSTWSYNFDIPGSYTAFGGPTYTFSDIKDVYFLNSFSTLGDLSCIVEHFLITCTIQLVIPAGTVLDFNILLVNPSEMEVYWNFYVLDINTELVFKPLYQVTAKFTELPQNNLDIISIENDMTEKSLKISALINEEYTSKSIIGIKFPRNYNLDVDYPGIILCSATYYGETTLKFVQSGSLCIIEDNMVKFQIILSFTASNKFLTEFIIIGIDQPSGVQIRSDFLDIEDPNIYEKYDTWTEKFKLYSIVNPESTYISYSSSSYNNLNSAFTGYYNSDKMKITIQDSEILGITGGTYSEKFLISVNSKTLAALIIYLTAFDAHSSILKFSENGDFILTNNRPFAYFRVGAPSKSPAGFYYIKWTINENPIIENIYNYDTPQYTLVQLTNTLKIPISIAKIPSCVPGYPTLPISLTLDQISPFSGISVKFSRENSTDDYGLRPNPVSFTSNDLQKFFEINCLATLPVNNEFKFLISIEGEDKETFIIDSDKSFTTKSFSNIAVQADIKFEVYNETTVEVFGDSDTGAVCTWGLIATHLYDTNPSVGTYEYISSIAYPLTNTSIYTQIPLETQLASYESELSKISANTWEELTMKTLIFADKTFFAGMTYISQSVSTQILFYDKFIADKSYTFISYCSHPQSSTIQNTSLTINTYSLPHAARIYILFDNDIGQKDDEIKNVLAKVSNINKLRIIEDTGSTRRLTSSFYKLILPEAESTYTPMMIADDLDRDTFEKSMQAELNNYDIRIANLQYFEALPENFGSPQFDNQFWNTTDKSIILLNFTSNYKGKYCCEVEKDPDLNKTLTSKNILYGYDRSGIPNEYTYCKDIEAMTITTYSVKFADFSDPGNYDISCTVCNSYPILPLCLDDNYIMNYTFVISKDSGLSMMLVVELGFLVFLMI